MKRGASSSAPLFIATEYYTKFNWSVWRLGLRDERFKNTIRLTWKWY